MPEPGIPKPWPRPWTWAIVLAVVLFSAHATIRWWGPTLVQVLFGDMPMPADVPLLVWALLACWVILSLAGGMLIGSLVGEGSSVRDRALQRRFWDMEQQIREEAMPESEREWHRHYRQRQAEIRREARRRLGLPEEEP